MANYVKSTHDQLRKAMFAFDDAFSPVKDDILSMFWHNVEQIYREAALSFKENDEFNKKIRDSIRQVAVTTFEEATQTLQLTNPEEVFRTTRKLQILLNALEKKENENE